DHPSDAGDVVLANAEGEVPVDGFVDGPCDRHFAVAASRGLVLAEVHDQLLASKATRSEPHALTSHLRSPRPVTGSRSVGTRITPYPRGSRSPGNGGR